MVDKIDDDDGISFAPGFLEKMKSAPTDVQEALREMLANMRQAHKAWKDGQYTSFADAMEAITGQRPRPIDDEER